MPESSVKRRQNEPSGIDYRPPGAPCMCNRLNGTLGYVTPADCPACEGTAVVKNPVLPKDALVKVQEVLR